METIGSFDLVVNNPPASIMTIDLHFSFVPCGVNHQASTISQQQQQQQRRRRRRHHHRHRVLCSPRQREEIRNPKGFVVSVYYCSKWDCRGSSFISLGELTFKDLAISDLLLAEVPVPH